MRPVGRRQMGQSDVLDGPGGLGPGGWEQPWTGAQTAVPGPEGLIETHGQECDRPSGGQRCPTQPGDRQLENQ